MTIQITSLSASVSITLFLIWLYLSFLFVALLILRLLNVAVFLYRDGNHIFFFGLHIIAQAPCTETLIFHCLGQNWGCMFIYIIYRMK